MKLHEALSERKEVTQRIRRLEQRLESGARVPEGNSAPEKYDDLRADLTGALDRLRELNVQINLTNVSAQVDGTGETITQAIARRDMLKEELRILQAVAGSASGGRSYGGERIKYVSTMDIAALQAEIDRKSKEWRELDTKLQTANFKVDLAAT